MPSWAFLADRSSPRIWALIFCETARPEASSEALFMRRPVASFFDTFDSRLLTSDRAVKDARDIRFVEIRTSGHPPERFHSVSAGHARPEERPAGTNLHIGIGRQEEKPQLFWKKKIRTGTRECPPPVHPGKGQEGKAAW